MVTKVPGNDPRTKGHGNESSSIPREQKFRGTKVSRELSNFHSSGTKVLHRDLSFLGTKGIGTKKSNSIHDTRTFQADLHSLQRGSGYEYG